MRKGRIEVCGEILGWWVVRTATSGRFGSICRKRISFYQKRHLANNPICVVKLSFRVVVREVVKVVVLRFFPIISPITRVSSKSLRKNRFSTTFTTSRIRIIRKETEIWIRRLRRLSPPRL